MRSFIVFGSLFFVFSLIFPHPSGAQTGWQKFCVAAEKPKGREIKCFTGSIFSPSSDQNAVAAILVERNTINGPYVSLQFSCFQSTCPAAIASWETATTHQRNVILLQAVDLLDRRTNIAALDPRPCEDAVCTWEAVFYKSLRLENERTLEIVGTSLWAKSPLDGFNRAFSGCSSDTSTVASFLTKSAGQQLGPVSVTNFDNCSFQGLIHWPSEWLTALASSPMEFGHPTVLLLVLIGFVIAIGFVILLPSYLIRARYSAPRT